MGSNARYKAFMAPEASDDGDLLQFENYNATLSEIDASKLPLLHELAMSVFWPHRGRDISLFIKLGQGYIALDEIGRPLGSAMYFPLGDDFAMLGMMVVTPRLQGGGAGRRLLRRIMRECEGRELRITATRSSRSFYEAAGFEPVCEIIQQQGVAKPIKLPEPLPGLILRPMTPADHPAVLELDRVAYGADRTRIMEALFPISEGIVALRDGKVVGYAMKRPFGRGTVVGPIVAPDDDTAMQMAAPLVKACEGKFTRVDSAEDNARFRAFLSAAGLGVYDTVTEMRLGEARRPMTGTRVFGMASHSLG